MKYVQVSLSVLLLIIIPSSPILHGQGQSNSGKPIAVTRLRSCPLPCSFAAYSGLDDPLRLLIRDREAWREIWKRIHGHSSELPPLPEIDFSREIVVIVALGAKPTGGYGIIVDGAYERDDRLEVVVSSQSAGKSCAVTQAVTQPVDIVRLPKTEHSVVFREKEEVFECEQKRKSAVPPNPVGQELDCQYPMSCIHMAQSLADRGEHLDAALAYVQRAFSIPPLPNDAVPRESFFLVLAYVRIKRGEFEEAIATLKRGIAGAPYYSRDERYLSYLGLAYEKTGRIDDAIEAYISLAGGIKTVSDKPGAALLALYRKRYGSLIGLEERIEAKRRKSRREVFVDSQLLSIPAPDWVLQDLDGRDVNLSDFANRVVVLRFVGTQSGDDVEKLKFLQKQYEKYQKRGVAFICIDEGYPHPIEQRRQNIRRALDQVGVNIPIVIDPDGEVAKRYHTIESLIVLIDETGTIRFKNWLWHDYHPFVTEQIEYLLKAQE